MAEDFRTQYGGIWEIPDVSGEYHNEQNLFESFIIESNDIFGIPINYFSLILDKKEIDKFYGEHQNEKFLGPYRTKVTAKLQENVDLVNQFGMVPNETLIEITIPMYTFSRDCDPINPPKVGDVIHFLYNDKYYELTDVDDFADIFIGKKMSWRFEAKPYRTVNDETSASIDTMIGEPLSAFGDNIFIEDEANKVDDLSDLPSFDDIYGIKS